MKKVIYLLILAVSLPLTAFADSPTVDPYPVGAVVAGTLKNQLRAYAIPKGGPVIGEVVLSNKIKLQDGQYDCSIPFVALASLATERVALSGFEVLCQSGLKTIQFKKRAYVMDQGQTLNVKGAVNVDAALGPYVELDPNTKVKVVFVD